MPDENNPVVQVPNLKRRILCNNCGSETHHTLAFEHHGQNGDPTEDQFLEEWRDSLWVCCGCEAATLIHEWRMAGAEGMKGAPQPETYFYPPRTVGKRVSKHFVKLPKELKKLYGEVIDSFNSGLMVLCTIGLRTLLEGVCRDKGIRGTNLEQRIDGLSAYFPNQTLIDSLHAFRFTGNEAAHEMAPMYPTEASNAIEVMEDLLNYLYEFDYNASRLKNAGKQAEVRRQRSAPNSRRVQ